MLSIIFTLAVVTSIATYRLFRAFDVSEDIQRAMDIAFRELAEELGE